MEAESGHPRDNPREVPISGRRRELRRNSVDANKELTETQIYDSLYNDTVVIEAEECHFTGRSTAMGLWATRVSMAGPLLIGARITWFLPNRNGRSVSTSGRTP